MISYSVTGDDDAGDFFYVHPDNGDITLLQSVFETEKRQYKVCKQLACFNTCLRSVQLHLIIRSRSNFN